MFRILDGREHFYQWDLDRKLVISDDSITQVHFCNKTDDCSLVVDVYADAAARLYLADVPNILLQEDWDIRVYGYCNGCYTKQSARFKVKARTKPADYVYTETEVKRAEDILDRAEDTLERAEAAAASAEYILNEYEPIDAELRKALSVKGTESGSSLYMTDVSPLKHPLQLSVKISAAGGDIDLDNLCVSDLLGDYGLKCHLSSTDKIISYIEQSPNWEGDKLFLYKNPEWKNDLEPYDVYILNCGDGNYHICENDYNKWGSKEDTLTTWTEGFFDCGSLHHMSGDNPIMTEEGLYLILGVGEEEEEIDLTTIAVTVSTPITVEMVGYEPYYLNLKCAFSTVEELQSYLEQLNWSENSFLKLITFTMCMGSPEWVAYYVRNDGGNSFTLYEDNNTWGMRDFSLSQWVNGEMDAYFHGIMGADGIVELTKEGSALILGNVEIIKDTYHPDADGVVHGATPLYPAMQIATDNSSAILSCTYEKDVFKYITQLIPTTMEVHTTYALLKQEH